MTANTTTWIRRVIAGAFLAAAAALIALGTAAASHAEGTSTSPSFSPTPHSVQYPYGQAGQSWHDRHAADIQSWYR